MTVGITDKPAVPKGRLVGGKQVLAVEVRGLLGATAVAGRPAVTAVSTASEVSSEMVGPAGGPGWSLFHAGGG